VAIPRKSGALDAALRHESRRSREMGYDQASVGGRRYEVEVTVQSKNVPSVADHAIFGEYASRFNKKMVNGLNRRVFNREEVTDKNGNIILGTDGAITLNPGMYRIMGFSNVTMQDELWPSPLRHATTYPGYCLVYRKEDEPKSQDDLLPLALGIGSPTAAAYFAPSTFDLVAVIASKTEICAGHQVGASNDEVYLSIYEIDGTKSDYHAVARIGITRL
jgi:hypothetical protein